MKPLNIGLIFVGIIIGILVLLEVSAAVVPDAITSGNSLNVSNSCPGGCTYNSTQSLCVQGAASSTQICQSGGNIPLAGLFSGSGVLFVLVAIGLFIAGLQIVLRKRK